MSHAKIHRSPSHPLSIGLCMALASSGVTAHAQGNFEHAGVFTISDATHAGNAITINHASAIVNLVDGGVIGNDGLHSVLLYRGTFNMLGGQTVDGRLFCAGATHAVITGGSLGARDDDSITVDSNATLLIEPAPGRTVSTAGKIVSRGATVIDGGAIGASWGTSIVCVSGELNLHGGSLDGAISCLETSRVTVTGGAIGANGDNSIFVHPNATLLIEPAPGRTVTTAGRIETRGATVIAGGAIHGFGGASIVSLAGELSLNGGSFGGEVTCQGGSLVTVTGATIAGGEGGFGLEAGSTLLVQPAQGAEVDVTGTLYLDGFTRIDGGAFRGSPVAVYNPGYAGIFWGNSTTEIHGGSLEGLIWNDGELTIDGGHVGAEPNGHNLSCWGTGRFTISSGTLAGSIGTLDAGELVVLGGVMGTDGDGDSVWTAGTSHAEVRGGSFGALSAYDDSVIDVYGCLKLEGGVLSGYLEDGTAVSIPVHEWGNGRVRVHTADQDLDGLCDAAEAALGTNPFDPDTDHDGLLDGTEVDVSEGSGCPDPLFADSDGDTLLDGQEVTVSHTSPCSRDTDDDGIWDGTDPLPLDPGVPVSFIEDHLRNETVSEIQALALTAFSGNKNAASGRRNALANKVTAAANAAATGDVATAIEQLSSVLDKIDDQPSPADWMEAGAAKTALYEEVELYLKFLGML